MFDTILVPLDGSELAERALGPALALARQRQGHVILLRVPVYREIMVPGTAGYGLLLPDQSLENCREDADCYLKEVRQKHSHPNVTLDTELVDGDIAGCIVDTAATKAVDLITMTTHGYSGVTRWMLGSVTERVLRSAPCPVLAVRHERPIKSILITLDGSRLAEQALIPGMELARSLGARVTLLQVDQDERLGAMEASLLEVARAGLSRQIEAEDTRRHVESYLHNLADKWRRRLADSGSPDVEIETVVMAGRPAQSVLELAESQQIDLIAMATHGHSGLRRWVYGSITEKVLRNVDCAMLIVRPPDDSLK
jgi:nucleotide-binding universal stress UspA family protein